MEAYNAEMELIKTVLKANPRGMTVINLAKELNISRNSAAKYLDILLALGRVEMESVGPAKLFYLSNRVPSSMLFNYSSDYILVLGEDFKVIQVNDNLLNLIGAKKENTHGQNLDDLSRLISLKKEIIPKIKKMIEENDQNKEINTSIVDEDLYLKVKIIPSIFEDGSPGITIVMNDVAKERKMEKALAKYSTIIDELRKDFAEQIEGIHGKLQYEECDLKIEEDALHRRYEKNQAILESLPDFIFIIRKDGTIIDYIAANDENLFLPPPEFLGRKVNEVLPEETSKQVLQCIDKVLQAGEICSVQYKLPLDNKNRHYEARIVSGKENEVIAIVRDISDQRKTEKALEESERLFKTLFEQAYVGVAQVAPDGAFLKVNERFAQILGYSPVELISKSFRDITHPDDLELDNKHIQKVFSGDIDSFEIEKRYIHKEGHDVWINLYSSVVKDKNNSILYAIGVITDITDRKKTEKALEESERLFKTLFEQAHVGVAQVAPDGTFLKVNERFAEIIGYSPVELISKNFRDITHPDDLELDNKYIQQAFAGDIDSFEVEKRYIHKEGYEVWINIYSRAVRNENNSIIFAIGVITNITERKMAEKSLKESERKFKAIFENSNDGIYLYELNGQILEVNKIACQQMGYSQDEILEISPAELVVSSDHLKEMWDKTLEDGHSIFEIVGIRKDGSYIPLEISSRVIDDTTPKILIISRDLTVRKRAEEDLKKSEELVRMIFDNAKDAILLISAEGQILEMNPAAYEQLGYTKSEILQMKLEDIDFYDDATQIEKRYNQLLQNNHLLFETALVRKDKSIFPAEICLQIIEYMGQKTVLCISREVK